MKYLMDLNREEYSYIKNRCTQLRKNKELIKQATINLDYSKFEKAFKESLWIRDIHESFIRAAEIEEPYIEIYLSSEIYKMGIFINNYNNFKELFIKFFIARGFLVNFLEENIVRIYYE